MAWVLRPSGSIIKSISSSVKISRLASTSAITTSDQALSGIPSTRVTTLDNGMRVATEDNSGYNTATVGLWIDAGPRYETPENNGVTHFFEHMALKGTQNRSHTDLQKELESLGAHLHAYTTRDHTVFYSKCFSDDIPKAVEILSDVVQNSKLDEAEIDKERGVILQEIEESANDMHGLMLDHLHSTAFQGTPLAKTVLGTEENVMSLSRGDLAQYVNKYYKPSRMVLAGAGGVSHDALVKLAEQHFQSQSESAGGAYENPAFCRYTGSDVRIREDSVPFTHIAVGMKGPGFNSPEHIPMLVAKSLIGSWDRTMGGGLRNASYLARMFLEYDHCHMFQAFNISYSDIGLWGLYFLPKVESIMDCNDLIAEEWKRICISASPFEVERAKNSLKTDVLLELQGTTAVCADIGKQVLQQGKRLSLQEQIAKIEATTVDDVRNSAMNCIYNKCPVLAAMGTFDHTLSYETLRGQMYWFRF